MSSRAFLYGAAILFALSRIAMFVQPVAGWANVSHYHVFALEVQESIRRGTSFYELHARDRNDEMRDVEYPPLFIALVLLPLLWTNTPLAEDYQTAFNRWLMVWDCVGFALFLLCVMRNAGLAEDCWERTAIYALGSALLWPFLYETMDLPLGVIMLGALALLTSGSHYLWSFLALAAGVNLKLVPIVLAPVWVVGSLPVTVSPWSRRGIALMGARSALLIGMIVLMFLPFLCAEGTGTLHFFRYHARRGIEWNSVSASILVNFDTPVEFYPGYGSLNVHTPWAPTALSLMPWIAAALFAVAAFVLLHKTGRLATPSSSDTLTFAQWRPELYSSATLWFLMLFVTLNKVFSAEYMLSLVPFAALLPWRGTGRRVFQWTFVVICGLSTLQWNANFQGYIPIWSEWRQSFQDLRNVLLVLLTAWLGISFLRAPESHGGAPSETAP